jgi:hypothetical protein
MTLEKSVKIKQFTKFLWILLLTPAVISCATDSKAYKEMDTAVQRTEFYTAVEELERGQRRKRAIYPEGNSISMYMDKGLLEHYSGNWQNSSEDLQNAERLIEEAYTKSISQGFFSYIINDNTRDYPGEDFEDIYINIFNALNYYNRGNMEGALVEIRKLTISSGKLDMLARKYEYIDPDTGRSLNDRVQSETGISQLPDTKTTSFSNSALARYLSALFYQGIGNTDASRLEFDQIQRAFNTNNNIYSFPVPQAVQQARDVPDGLARLNIISFAGLSPIKEEAVIAHYLPFRHPILQIAAFRLPVLVRRPSRITGIEVVVDGKNRFNLELLENLGTVIEDTFNARFATILLKTYIRTILKYVVADAAAIETARQQNEFAGLLVAVGARTAMDLSEGADIRMSRYLPERAYIGGINLDPGTYSVIINYYNGNSIIDRRHYDNVIVNSNGLNLLESVNLR